MLPLNSAKRSCREVPSDWWKGGWTDQLESAREVGNRLQGLLRARGRRPQILIGTSREKLPSDEETERTKLDRAKGIQAKIDMNTRERSGFWLDQLKAACENGDQVDLRGKR
ncbi:hypothetical protein M5K25_000067 [Dendrobium thyrsiflorum]|uniref:Uncharacterized protein n=1 Tax=Dendrobium thyrsiflorum TaxID=117978 RepID=A0ABD0W4V7_DENTH